jgi:hypothetical protein
LIQKLKPCATVVTPQIKQKHREIRPCLSSWPPLSLRKKFVAIGPHERLELGFRSRLKRPPVVGALVAIDRTKGASQFRSAGIGNEMLPADRTDSQSTCKGGDSGIRLSGGSAMAHGRPEWPTFDQSRSNAFAAKRM